MCSGNITVNEALQKVVQLQVTVNKMGESQFEMPEEISETHHMILHKAAGIIRNSMSDLHYQSHQYEPSGQFNKEKCKDFIPDSLHNFISWCVSKKDFEITTKFDEGQKVNPDPTPITFGLGVKLHHDFGSCAFIQDLYSLGHCIHYDEVRRFLTTVSDNEIKAQSRDGIPGGISLYDPSNINSIVDAAIDNFDQRLLWQLYCIRD